MYLRALLQTDLCNVQGDGERGFGEMHVRGEKKPRKHRWSDGGMTVGGKGIQRGRKHFPLCTPSIDRIAQRICECDTVGYRTGGIKSLMRNQGKT